MGKTCRPSNPPSGPCQLLAGKGYAGYVRSRVLPAPPYWEARPTDWVNYMESLMDMRNIKNPYDQQDAITDVLKKKREPGGYQLIKD